MLCDLHPGKIANARIRLLVCLALVCLFNPHLQAETEFRPVRGVWVANVGSPTLTSPEAIRNFVALAHECGINTLYVVVWNRGLTTYPSQIMKQRFGTERDMRYQDFDVLKETTQAAHERGISVIAWFEFGFSSSYQEPDGGHILRKYPHWAAREATGAIASKNGFQWMNSFHPEVQDFVLSLLKEIIRNYDVDGVQGDDRLPACPSIAGYDDWTRKLYQQQHEDKLPPPDHMSPAWIEWRVQLLNSFMRRMSIELKQMDKDIVVSIAPSVFPWSREHYLQDWPTWVNQGWVDEVCPQVYRESVASYASEMNKIMSQQVVDEHRSKVFPGILVQTADEVFNNGANLRAMVDINRDLGVEGEVFFYDAAVLKNSNFFRQLYK